MAGLKGLIKKMLILTVAVFMVLVSNIPALAEIPEKVRVGIITSNTGSSYLNAASVTFSVKGNYQIIDLAAIPGDEVIAIPAEGEQWKVFYLPGGVQVYQNENIQKITTGYVMVQEVNHSSENRVCLVGYANHEGQSVNIGKWYRGNMEFRNSGAALTVINDLSMDEYLYGVVPREMSDGWPLEALKAQAIAARTYTVANYNKRIVEGFNVLDTKYDQAYGGFNSEGDNAARAVNETTGKIIVYAQKPISAVYHSTSGGHTEDNENVWGTTPVPYLRGKPDPCSTNHGFADWTYTVSLDDVRNRVIQTGNQIGPINSFTLEKLPSGRVKSVIINDINGNTITMTGTGFGQMFNPGFYTYLSSDNFMSRLFDIKTDQVMNPSYYVINSLGQNAPVEGTNLYAATDEGTAVVLNETSAEFYIASANGISVCSKSPAGMVVFEGHGWGHGVGMSQWGAYEMAKQGKNYLDILSFYYTGVQITSDYNS
ncbi:SpoIID/LytB domain-containing protein [Phosphitispora sp. TUW77]|uniref:SpoIID/LytB domain-containing protein n=1 Tax=Phosphitispora sp. TUW77 TaxID=3152361 RepID=UPI003AB57636